MHTHTHTLALAVEKDQLTAASPVAPGIHLREKEGGLLKDHLEQVEENLSRLPSDSLVGNLTRLMSNEECRSPIGLDCCSCCLDLANGCEPEPGQASLGSPTSVNHFKQLRDQLHFQNLNTDKLNNIMRQDSLESVVRDPCYLLNEGICNSNIDQTMLSILLFFHRYVNKLTCITHLLWHTHLVQVIKTVKVSARAVIAG